MWLQAEAKSYFGLFYASMFNLQKSQKTFPVLCLPAASEVSIRRRQSGTHVGLQRDSTLEVRSVAEAEAEALFTRIAFAYEVS